MLINEASPPPPPARWHEAAIPGLVDLLARLDRRLAYEGVYAESALPASTLAQQRVRSIFEGLAPRPRSWSGLYARQPDGSVTRID